MTSTMFIHDITVGYGDFRNDSDELLLIIRSTDEDQWYSIPLVQEEKEWNSGVSYLEVNSSSFWVTVANGMNDCVGHVFWEPLGHTSSGQHKLSLDARDAQTKLTLGWTISQERPGGYIASAQISKLSHLSAFAEYFYRRFRDDISLPYSLNAAEASTKAGQVASTPAEKASTAAIFARLGLALDAASRRTKDSLYLEQAISVLRKSIALTSDNDLALPERLKNLGIMLERKFQQTYGLETMQEAISCYRRAVDLAPRTDTEFQSRLSLLSNALATRSSFTGAIADIEEALSLQRDYVCEQDTASPQLPQALNELGLMLMRRAAFGRSGGGAVYIREAIAAYQRALTLLGPGHCDIPALHNRIGHALRTAYFNFRQLEDLEEAIESTRKAIDLLDERHVLLPSFLSDLAKLLMSKFDRDRSLETIGEAIDCQERCIRAAPEEYKSLPEWYDGLALSLSARFNVVGEVDDIDRAIEISEKALSILPRTHVNIPHFEFRLGGNLVKKSMATHRQEDIREAIKHYRNAASCSQGHISLRIYAAEMWAQHARTVDIQSSLEGYERAIELISIFVGLEQTRNRRHESIAEIHSLSRSAAATALEAGEVMKAVEWLERGRCVVWDQLNSLRAPVDELRLVDEELAERVMAISKTLQGSSGPITGKDVSVDLVLEWNSLIARVRQIDGFEEFLRTKSFAMSDLPPSGTIIIINVHDSRCDALALRCGWSKPLHIPLPDLSLGKTQRMAERLRGYLGLSGARIRGYDLEGDEGDERAIRRMQRAVPQATLREILRELWKCVVKPILDTMKQPESGGALERIWWCPTGPLSFLPLHAAGAFEGDCDTLPDFAISSYTPSLRILINKLRVENQSSANQSGLLVISQPNTPGHTPLPGTSCEVEALQKVLQGSTVKTVHIEGELATTDVCASAMVHHSSVHLACHAFQDAKEPLSSGFLLHDGRLELEHIMRNNLEHVELAFLSACQTSTGDEKLSEEALHLAAGMVAAGYRGVIATMWSIKDKYAPEVTTSFYTELLRLSAASGEAGIDGAKAAGALHYAVRQLRAKLGDGEDGLLTWVPYVHLGV